MKKSVVVAFLALLAAAAFAASSSASHYRMGPAHRFEPAAGDKANLISFANGIIIDTRAGEPTLPAGLAARETPGQAGYYIIQFEGPIRREWVRELERRGIEPFGYLPNYAMLARLDRAQYDLVKTLPRVSWVGLFQPAYKLQHALLDAHGFREVVIQLMPGETRDALVDFITASGGTVIEALTTSFATTVRAGIAADLIPEIAQLQEVCWIQGWVAPDIANNQCQWVTQTGWKSSGQPDTSMAVRTSWQHGVRGQRVILSTTDTGLNLGHDLFRDPDMSVTPPGIWPDHRKVVAFKLYQGADAGENPYHGSHVNGTVAGDDSIVGGTSYYDGMAFKGRLYFVDVSAASGGFVIGADLTPLWDSVYKGRGLPDSLRPILQTSGSWGAMNSDGDYQTMDASTDAYCWAHPDFLNIFAAGNEGSSARTLRNPGIAKNVITVGATDNGTSANAIANFSSRGPTEDNRIKPTICAPGVSLYSASPYPSTNGYSPNSGTSMATPAVNGTIGLMRCYLREGYYPTGSPVPGDAIGYISSALLRSMAIASADPNVSSYTVPSFDIGWGRIDADSVLYYTGDARRLILKDDTAGLGTGEYLEEQFAVNSDIPLRIALAWTDTAAAVGANPTLVNDLNLEVVGPSGTWYRGNQYSGGQSVADPGSWDDVNVEECVRVNSPETGTWTIRVRGQNVATAAKQRFAYTITGDVGPLGTSRDVGVQRIVAPSGTVDSGSTVAPQAWVKNYGSIAATFPVKMRIGSGYTDNQTVTGLAPGDSIAVDFNNWTATARGAQTVRCSTGLSSDQYTANDTLSGSVTVRVTNVGVTKIIAPTGNVDSGTMTTPQARVKNSGTAAASFPVTFTMGTFYTDSKDVNDLAPGESVTVNFDNWTWTQPGTFATHCSTALGGDQIRTNDTLSGSVTVRVLNVGVTQILSPTGTVDSGVAVTPQAEVRNYGSTTVSFPVTFHVGSVYSNSQNVTSLAPGASVQVNFTNWTPAGRGTFATRCSTGLAGDQIHTNDTLSGSVTVRVTNAGVTRIFAPTGIFDSGASVQPQARVKNFGTDAASFPVTFTIGTFYTDAQNVSDLAPGESVLVSFAAWDVIERGIHTTRCWTALSGDLVRGNDTLSGTVTVRIPGDVGVSRILAPTGTYDSGASATPQAVVWNYGDIVLSFPVTFRIGSGYTNTQTVSDLAPGESAVVSFADWSALQRGTSATGCTTALAGDTVTANDGVSDSVTVRVQDIGVSGISSPAGTYEPGREITPTVMTRNFGSVPADFGVWMFITDPTGAQFYAESTNVTNVPPGTNLLVDAFRPCTLKLTGDWTAKCSTAMAGDAKLANNVLVTGFVTRSVWFEVKPIPGPPSGRPVKDGAWLAYHDANGFIYAGKGNKTGDFFCYNPGTGNWTQLHDVPLGMEGKQPRKGACGAADGSRYVYMAKGNNTLGFWRYDVAGDAWFQLPGVPAGSNKVKAGAAAVYVQTGDTGYVYLLKGGRSEFCRYNTVTYAWEALPAAPFGAKPKWDKGSFLVYDGASTIYAHKGKYQELWAFDLPTQTWGTSSMNGMPFMGRSGRTKKSKDGGSGAWVGGCIYALKGGNTSEFWRYTAATDSWLELDTMPSYGSTGKARRVNAGGSMCSAAGTLYALKGNKTFEFWRFAPGFVAATQPVPQPTREGVMASSVSVPRSSFLVSPNPLAAGFVHLALGGKALSRPALVRLYDATGRCVGIWRPLLQNGAADLDLRHLAAGVYLVKVEADDFSATQRLVVQK